MQKPGHLKGISCKTTPDAFAKAFSGEAIATELTKLIADRSRNGMISEIYLLIAPHQVVRSTRHLALPFLILRRTGRLLPLRVSRLTQTSLNAALRGLVDTLAKLVSAADVFAQKHF